jgi:hypothetical protein
MSAAAQIGDFDTLVASYLKAQEDLAEVFGAQCGIGCGTCAKCELVSAASQSLILQIEAFNHQIENFGSALKVPEVVVPEDLKDPEVGKEVPEEDMKVLGEDAKAPEEKAPEVPQIFHIAWAVLHDQDRVPEGAEEGFPPCGTGTVGLGHRTGEIRPFNMSYTVQVTDEGVYLTASDDSEVSQSGHVTFRVGDCVIIELPSDHGPGCGVRIIVCVTQQEPACITPVSMDTEDLESSYGQMLTIFNERLEQAATRLTSGKQLVFHDLRDEEALELEPLQAEGGLVLKIIDDMNASDETVIMLAKGAGYHQFEYEGEHFGIFITPKGQEPLQFEEDDDSDSEDVPPAKGSRKRQRSPSKSPSPKRHCS